jgi:hypothetical protein
MRPGMLASEEVVELFCLCLRGVYEHTKPSRRAGGSRWVDAARERSQTRSSRLRPPLLCGTLVDCGQLDASAFQTVGQQLGQANQQTIA